MAEVKRNIRIDLSNQHHLAPKSVSNADFVKDVCISTGTVANHHKGLVYEIHDILNDGGCFPNLVLNRTGFVGGSNS